MSELKFSCTQCGQHIAADEAWSGRQIQCPKCQAALVVPAVPAASTTIRPSAPPPPPLPPQFPSAPAPAVSAPARPKSKSPVLWIVLGAGAVCLVGALAVGVLAYRMVQAKQRAESRSRAAQMSRNNPAPPRVATQSRSADLLPTPADPKVQTDPATVEIPNTPTAGTIRGSEFKPDSALITSQSFTLKQGKEFFPDASLTFFLFLKPDQKLPGRTITIASQDKSFPKPHIHVARKGPDQRIPKTEIVTQNYALRLEFGEQDGDKLPGRIYLELGESFGTKVSGTFEAKVGK